MVMEDPPKNPKPPGKRSSYFETLNSVTSQLDFLLTDLSTSDALFSPMSPLDLGRNVEDLQSADFLFRPQNELDAQPGYKRLPLPAEQKPSDRDGAETTQSPPKGYTDVFTFKSRPAIMEEGAHQPEISMRTRLFYTKPVWFLPNIHRPAAVHYLQGQPTGTFIVRASSRQGSLCLSMKHPGTAGGAYIEHTNIITSSNGYRLDPEEDVYPSLDELILHHCSHRETLPCPLQLPHALGAAKTGAELQSFAILEQEFWKSPHSRAHSHQQQLQTSAVATPAPGLPLVHSEPSITVQMRNRCDGDDLMDTRDPKDRILSLYKSAPNSRHSWSSDTSGEQWLKPSHRRSSSDVNRQIMRYSNEAERLDLSYVMRHPPPTFPPPLPPLGTGTPLAIPDQQEIPPDSGETVIPRSNGHYNRVRALSSDGSSVRSQSTISVDSLISMGRDSTCSSSSSSRQSNSSLPPYPSPRLSEQFPHLSLYDQPEDLETLPPPPNLGILPPPRKAVSPAEVEDPSVDIHIPSSELSAQPTPSDAHMLDTRSSVVTTEGRTAPLVGTRTEMIQSGSLQAAGKPAVTMDAIPMDTVSMRDALIGSDTCSPDSTSLLATPRISVDDVSPVPPAAVTVSSRGASIRGDTGVMRPAADTTEPSSVAPLVRREEPGLCSSVAARSSQTPPDWLVVGSSLGNSRLSQESIGTQTTGAGVGVDGMGSGASERPGDASSNSELGSSMLNVPGLSQVIRPASEGDLDLSVLEFRGSFTRRRSWNPPAVADFDPLLISPPPEFQDHDREADDRPIRESGSDAPGIETGHGAKKEELTSQKRHDNDTTAAGVSHQGADKELIPVTDNSDIDLSRPFHRIGYAPAREGVDDVQRLNAGQSSGHILDAMAGHQSGSAIVHRTKSDLSAGQRSDSIPDSMAADHLDGPGIVQRSNSELSGECLTASESMDRSSAENLPQSSSETAGEDMGRSSSEWSEEYVRLHESLPVSNATTEDEDIAEGEVSKRMGRANSLPNALTPRGTNEEGIFQGSRSAMFIKEEDESRGSSLTEDDFEIVDQDTSWNSSENSNSNRSFEEGSPSLTKSKKGRKFSSQLLFHKAKKSSKKVHKKLKPTWSKKMEILDPAASIQAVVKRLANDSSTRLGAMVDSFIRTTVDKCETHPPDAVLKGIRQFMSGVKNYLFNDQEPEVEAQLDKYCNLLGMEVDAIFEGVLHQILLGPLRDQIYLCFIRHFNESGSLTLLDRNFRAAKEKIPSELGIKANFIPPTKSSLRSIKERFTEIQRAFSPIQKLEYLLRVVREIYSAVSDTGLGRNAITSMGADDFLPMLIYVLVHCDQIHIEIEVEYMWGLLDPSLLSGEGGYYLTTLSSAICVLKQLEEETESETKGFLTVFVARGNQPGDVIMKTVPVLPAMTSVEVCNAIIQKLDLDRDTPHSIFLLSDGNEQALESHCSIYKIKTDYESMENKLCKFCIRPENIAVKWPVISTNLKAKAVNNT